MRLIVNFFILKGNSWRCQGRVKKENQPISFSTETWMSECAWEFFFTCRFFNSFLLPFHSYTFFLVWVKEEPSNEKKIELFISSHSCEPIRNVLKVLIPRIILKGLSIFYEACRSRRRFAKTTRRDFFLKGRTLKEFYKKYYFMLKLCYQKFLCVKHRKKNFIKILIRRIFFPWLLTQK